jgi:hypothetical protein
MDFFVAPTVRFQLLYVWFVLDHDRRRLIHFNVTTSPTARWAIQQLREALPLDTALPFLVYDRDSIFSAEVTAGIRTRGTEPVRTARRSPWQNPFAERWIGTCRRELLDHVVVLGERHLRRLLAEYVDYYNAEQVYTRLEDSPDGRPSESRPPAPRRHTMSSEDRQHRSPICSSHPLRRGSSSIEAAPSIARGTRHRAVLAFAQRAPEPETFDSSCVFLALGGGVGVAAGLDRDPLRGDGRETATGSRH